MHILEFEHKHFGVEDLKSILPSMGHQLTVITTPLILERVSEEFDQLFDSLIQGKAVQCTTIQNTDIQNTDIQNTDIQNTDIQDTDIQDTDIQGKDHTYDAVFTFNYSVVVSNCCNRHNIPYIAWVYDSPLVALYSYTITNPCNHIFLFDSAQYLELKNGGIDTVYYMPLAANTERLDKLTLNEHIHQVFDSDISFVGSMYNEKGNFYDRIYDKLTPWARGYLDAIIAAQQNIYGMNFLEEMLSGTPETNKILAELMRIEPYSPSHDGIETPAYAYANYFLARKVAQNERTALLSAVSKRFKTKLYTHNKTPDIPHIINKGPIDFYDNMPYVFKCSKINLNITVRSIKNGIPLRCMDIMGAGGFLMTNFQSDFLNHFTPDVDYVYFESKDDLINKCDYYLKHDDKRREIAYNGHKKVKEFHNYRTRLNEIFHICGLE